MSQSKNYSYMFNVPRVLIRKWAAGMSDKKIKDGIRRIETAEDLIKIRVRGHEEDIENNDELLMCDKLEDILAILEVEQIMREFMEGGNE